MTTIEEDYAELLEALVLISADVTKAAAISKHEDSQFARRTYIRSVVALFEANANLMADVCIKSQERGEVSFTIAEDAALREENYTLDNKGIASSRKSFYPMQSRFRLVARLFGKIHNVEFNVDASNQGWEFFSRAIEIRNRINASA